MQNHPAIVAVGRTKFGEHYEKEPEKLIEEAWLRAAEKVDMERKDLKACYLSDYFLPFTNKVGLEEGFLSELTELHVPMEASRSFSAALSNASNAIQAGTYDVVLVGGIEKMTDRWDKIRDDLMLLEDPWSYYAGGTPEANHELMLRAYIKEYGLNDEEIEQLHGQVQVTRQLELPLHEGLHGIGLPGEHAQVILGVGRQGQAGFCGLPGLDRAGAIFDCDNPVASLLAGQVVLHDSLHPDRFFRQESFRHP